MDWPEITKDTPLEEIKRIHQQIWQYVVENGEKPETPYLSDCVCCSYCVARYGGNCFYFPAKWHDESGCCHESSEFDIWNHSRTEETAQAVRDIPFKYELEKKGAEK